MWLAPPARLDERCFRCCAAPDMMLSDWPSGPQSADLVRSLGADPRLVDALDARAVLECLRAIRPQLVIHQLTAIPAALNMRRFDRDFARTKPAANGRNPEPAHGCSRSGSDSLHRPELRRLAVWDARAAD